MYLAALPQITAEDRLHQVESVAAGSGTMKSATEFIRDLQQKANPDGGRSRKANAADLAAMGIEMVASG